MDEKENLKYRNRGLKCLFYGLIIMVISLSTMDNIYFMIISVIGMSIFTILGFYFIFIKWDFIQSIRNENKNKKERKEYGN